MKRKLLSVFIAAVMIVTVLPGSVFAGDTGTQQLYWFYSTNCSVDSDGRVDSGGKSGMQVITTDRVTGGRFGYFAVKSGEDYYAVNSVEISANTGDYKLVQNSEKDE